MTILQFFMEILLYSKLLKETTKKLNGSGFFRNFITWKDLVKYTLESKRGLAS